MPTKLATIQLKSTGCPQCPLPWSVGFFGGARYVGGLSARSRPSAVRMADAWTAGKPMAHILELSWS